MTSVNQTSPESARRRLREFFIEHADEIGKLKPSQQNDLANIVYLEGKRAGSKYLAVHAKTRSEASRKANVTRAERRLIRLLKDGQTLRPVNEEELKKNFARYGDEGLFKVLRSHESDEYVRMKVRIEASYRSTRKEGYGAFYHWS